jgi:hypothetical protein
MAASARIVPRHSLGITNVRILSSLLHRPPLARMHGHCRCALKALKATGPVNAASLRLPALLVALALAVATALWAHLRARHSTAFRAKHGDGAIAA